MGKLFISLFSISLILTSCGKEESQKISPKEQNITPEQMQNLIANQNIYCNDYQFCPEGLARMFSINFEDNRRSSMCAAFLVAEDLVMTNSHCIWTGKELDKTCSGLYFAFPTQLGITHTAYCSEILWRDQRSGGRGYYRKGDNDFALIRLDRHVPLTPLKLVSGGMTAGTRVYPLVMDHLDGFFAQVVKLDCKIKSLNKLGVAELENCPIISGNSGSAVVNKELEVVGIIFASSNNHVRKPTDPLNVRTTSNSVGFAFSVEQIQKVLSPHLY